MNIKTLLFVLLIFSISGLFAQSGNVGIGTTNPDTTLHVVGGFKLETGNPDTGKILTSDSSGLATWQNYVELDPSILVDSLNIVPRWDGFNLINGTILDDGTNVGIGVLNPIEKLEISGNIIVNDMMVGRGAATDFSNTVVGVDAYSTNSTGVANVAIGFRSLMNNSGSSNIGVGESSLKSNEFGLQNIAIGNKALFLNINGNNNAAVGAFSLFTNENGNNNVAIGSRAGISTTGSANIFIGYEAGKDELGSNKLYIDNSDTSTPLIYGDLADDTLKVYGTLNVGDAYSFPATDGSFGKVLATHGNGTLLWTDSMPQIGSLTINKIPRWIGNLYVDGTFSDDGTNVGLGTNPVPGVKFTVEGNASVTEDIIVNGIAIGRRENGGNMVFGNEALENISTGNFNTAIGQWALQNNENGFENTALGRSALQSNIDGSQNTGIGLGALAVNTTSSGNTAVGYTALGESTGEGNTAIGSSAMVDLLTGADNVAVGNGSMPGLNSGSNNTAIGHSSGHDAVGNGNIFIGHEAGYFETGDDKLYIDNSNTTDPLIYGDFDQNSLQINGTINISETAKLTPLATAPGCGAADAGLMYFDDTLKKLRVCDGTAWQNLH